MLRGQRIDARALVLALSSVACGESSPAPAPTPDPPPAQVAASEPPGTPGLVVHEWGLVDVPSLGAPVRQLAIGAVPGRGASATEMLEGLGAPAATPPTEGVPGETTGARPRPRPPSPEMRGRAPLLFVHLPAGHSPLDLTVRIAIDRGGIEEHWPLSEDRDRHGEWVRWSVTARPESCAGAAYPAADEPPCDDPTRFYCEASELRSYEADDAACLTLDGREWNHIFYRGFATGALPFRATREADGGVTLENASGAEIPGPLVLVRREDDAAASRVRVAAAPAAGQRSTLAAPDASADEGRRAVFDALAREFELTPAEVGGFRRAWDAALFGGAHAPTELVRRAGFAVPRESLLFFLPEEIVRALVALTIEPRPERVRRALLVRIDLDAEPRSYVPDALDAR